MSLKVVLKSMVSILMMSAKSTTLDLFKVNVFWNEDNDVIISVHDVSSKILLRKSNDIVDVIMGPKFDKSGISMREVITTSIIERFDQKRQFFW